MGIIVLDVRQRIAEAASWHCPLRLTHTYKHLHTYTHLHTLLTLAWSFKGHLGEQALSAFDMRVWVDPRDAQLRRALVLRLSLLSLLLKWRSTGLSGFKCATLAPATSSKCELRVGLAWFVACRMV